MEEDDNEEKIDKYVELVDKEEFKKVKSTKEVYSNLKLLNEIIEPLNETKIFFENPGLKIKKTVKSKIQVITYNEKLKYKEDDNLIKDIKCYQEIYEGNAVESNKAIEKIKNNFINLSKSVSNLVDLFEKVKNDFFSVVESMTNPILAEIEKIKEIDEKKFDKEKLKTYKEMKNKLNDNIDNYDKNLSNIIIEIKDILMKIKSNINTYIDLMNTLNGPINTMIDRIGNIFNSFEDKSREFINIIYKYQTSEEKQKAFNIFKDIQKLNKDILELIGTYGKQLDNQNIELENKKQQCLNDFDQITELNNNSIKKLNDLQIDTKNIIVEINELLKFCSLDSIQSDVKEYKGLQINSIKSNVQKGTENMIEANKKIEVDISKLKKFIEEKEEKMKNIISLDLAFIMDITGSMGPYLNFAKNKILSVIDQITKDSNISVRLGFVGYKDYSEEYIKYKDFTDNIQDVKNFISKAELGYGKDLCEDMVGGLNLTLEYSWKSNTRFAMLIADAPCHGVQYHELENASFDNYPEGDPKYKIDVIIQRFAERNINLLCLNLTEYTVKLYNNFKKYYQKGKNKNSNCDILVEKFDQDPEKLSGIIISQAKKLYERRHETVME